MTRIHGNQIDKYGNTEVAIQNQFTDMVSLYAINIKGTTTLTEAIAQDDVSIVVTSATGAVQYEAINISEDGKTYQGIVTNITGTTITLSGPITRAFTTASVVQFGAWNANVDGSTTAVPYRVYAPSGNKWDITGIKFNITDATEMDDAKFGGATALTNGILVRRVNGNNNKLLEVTSNGGFGEQHCTMEYSSKAPAGSYGLMLDLCLEDCFGVVARLDGSTGDYLELLVRDNLTVLTKFIMTVRGHEVE